MLYGGGGGLVASAALSGGRYLTPSETVDIIGDSLQVTYYDGSEMLTTSAVYVGADSAHSVDALYQQTDYLQTGLTTIVYKFAGSVVNDPQYISIDFSPVFALLDVEQVHTVCGVSCTGNDVSTTPWSTPQWIWTCAGEHTVFSGRADYGLHYRCELTTTFAPGELFDYVPVDWVHQGETSAFSQRAVFSYAQPAIDGYYYIVFGVPYISYDGSIDTISGTTSTSTTTTGGGSVDLSETNGLIGGVLAFIESIHDAIWEDPAEDFEPYEPEPVETMPELDYDESLDKFGDLMDEAPNITAAAGFWFALYTRILSADVLFPLLVLLCCALSLLSFILWK